jgi:hypothetical protein
MKTKIYFLALMAFTVQGTAKAQPFEPAIRSNHTEADISSETEKLSAMASYCDSMTRALWDAAQGRRAGEFKLMMEEISDFREQAQKLNLRIADLSYQKARISYGENRQSIQEMISEVHAAEHTLAQINNLGAEADDLFERAQKVREEAMMLDAPGAKLGVYYNAEELENTAFEKQLQAINLIYAYSPQRNIFIAAR